MTIDRFNFPIEYLEIGGIAVLSVNRSDTARGIIHFHGSDASKETDLLLILTLAREGYWLLVPDAPEHGERIAPPRKPFLKVVEMALMSSAREAGELIKYFRSAGVTDISLSGRSLGGMRAVHAAATHRFSRMSLLVTGGNIPLLFEKTASASVRTQETREMFATGYLKRALALEPLRRVHRIGAMPIFLAGGVKDEIMPIECVRALKSSLDGRSNFTYCEYENAGHALTAPMVKDLAGWFRGSG